MDWASFFWGVATGCGIIVIVLWISDVNEAISMRGKSK
jgi:hypothetical protein